MLTKADKDLLLSVLVPAVADDVQKSLEITWKKIYERLAEIEALLRSPTTS